MSYELDSANMLLLLLFRVQRAKDASLTSQIKRFATGWREKKKSVFVEDFALSLASLNSITNNILPAESRVYHRAFQLECEVKNERKNIPQK